MCDSLELETDVFEEPKEDQCSLDLVNKGELQLMERSQMPMENNEISQS